MTTRVTPWALVAAGLYLSACSSSPAASVPMEEDVHEPETRLLAPGSHLRPAAGERGALRFEGLRDEVLDLEGVHLRGASGAISPAEFTGYGLVLVDCHDVTVRGGRLGGYRSCLVLDRCSGVIVEDVVFDGWANERLLASESRADGYPSFGSALLATDCEGIVVRRCTGRRGQNGIELIDVERAQVYENDFSFLTGIGFRAERVAHSKIAHNRFDYCAREGRGGVAVGMLFERGCEGNAVSTNSATHSGIGLALGAGCSGNEIYGNDLRYSERTAIDLSGSQDDFLVANDLSASGTGVRATDVVRTLVHGNTIDDCERAAITFERGDGNVFQQNVVRNNAQGVHLEGHSSGSAEPGGWLIQNLFEGNSQDVVFKDVRSLVLFDNVWGSAAPRAPYLFELSAEGEEDVPLETLRGWLADRRGVLPSGHVSQTTLLRWEGKYPSLVLEVGRPQAPSVPGQPLHGGGESGDRSSVLVGEWGPWDFRADEPVPSPLREGGIFADVNWDARWFRWDGNSDPRKDLAVWRASEPLVRKTVPTPMDPWCDDDVRATVGEERFGLIAETQVMVDAGEYVLRVRSDDGVRVIVEGKEVLTDWTWHAERSRELVLPLGQGTHRFRLEYFQIDGAAALGVELYPR